MPGFGDNSQLAKDVFSASLQVKPGDNVWIQSWDHTLSLAEAFASECASRACPCFLTVRHEEVWLRSVVQSSKEQLACVLPQEKAALGETDCYIFTMGPRKPIPWSSIPEEKRGEISLWLDTRYDKSLYARRWARIARANKVKMLAIEATLATPERAKVQGLDYEEWHEIMFRGCMADHSIIARRASKLARSLSGKGRLGITTLRGTRFAFDLKRRPVDVSDGISTNEMAQKGRIVFLPAGVIEVSVNEESAEGRVVYENPVRLGDTLLENLILQLRDGSVVDYSATAGSEAFERYLKKGGKDSARFSYFGFGLNPDLRFGFTQDDKVLGGLTLGFGDNRSIGGKNSAKDQWWASTLGATVRIDDEPLMVAGKLMA